MCYNKLVIANTVYGMYSNPCSCGLSWMCTYLVCTCFRYVGCVSTSEAAIMLTDLFDGTFFVRETKEEKNEYAICVK